MNNKLQIASDAECRRIGERRQARLQSFFYGLYKARRSNNRRVNIATRPSYLDIHGHHIFALVLGIMLFCVADVYFTLMLIEHGSRELNPFLAWALEKDAMLFYSAKYIITAVCVFLMVQHQHFMVFGIRGYKFLVGVLVGYVLLITYQLSMLIHLV